MNVKIVRAGQERRTLRKKKAGLRPGIARVAAFGSALLVVAASEGRAADAAHGKLVFQNCAACHSDRPDAIGPTLRGVYGRKSGAVEGFHYSSAMMRANLTWDEANLRDYLDDPQAKVKGNCMPFGGFGDPKDVDDLIVYLKDYK